MSRQAILSVAVWCALTSPLFAAPTLNVVPGGIQSNNFVWDVSVTPDLALAGGSTPLAVELGFRLTGAPLLSATNINPAQWDMANPGTIIFGWETLTDVDPSAGVNLRPVGLQANTTTDEIFVAYGSVDFSTPGPKPFLRIIAQGPANGGGSLTSTIQWLGAYAQGHGRIAQLISGPPFAQNFDIFAGTVTQAVPEPTTAGLLLLSAVLLSARFRTRSL